MGRKPKEPDKLAQDAAAALAAGMPYGKWKAMQEPVKIIKKEDLPEGWRKCAWCGTPFRIKSSKKQIYCEIFCQRTAQAERERQKKGCAV